MLSEDQIKIVFFYLGIDSNRMQTLSFCIHSIKTWRWFHKML